MIKDPDSGMGCIYKVQSAEKIHDIGRGMTRQEARIVNAHMVVVVTAVVVVLAVVLLVCT